MLESWVLPQMKQFGVLGGVELAGDGDEGLETGMVEFEVYDSSE